MASSLLSRKLKTKQVLKTFILAVVHSKVPKGLCIVILIIIKRGYVT